MDLAASDQGRKGKMREKGVRKEKSTDSVKKLDRQIQAEASFHLRDYFDDRMLCPWDVGNQ